ncbi:MAG: hypothetical protein DMG21_04540 [Acidobacteria bacterium]|nr:MAG: hypothetical protein DMG21_04540 [Acidobacteriota bacterium]
MGINATPVKTKKPLYSEGKQLARRIFFETMAAIDVGRALRTKVKREGGALVAGNLSLPLLRPPRLVAFGKAAHRMAMVVSEILEEQVEAGISVAPSPPPTKLGRFDYFEGGHPYPNAGSFAGAEAALDLVSGLTADDFVIFLVSGGGSALFEIPFDPKISVADLAEFNRVLVTGGLPIEEMNTLRKHISAVKGGQLGARAYPARQLTLFISDVPEHLPSVVASGPTMADETTANDCYALAERHHLARKFPASIRRHFEEKTLAETPKPGDERFAHSRYLCLLSNRDAVEAAKAAAEKAGLAVEVDAHVWDADYREVAEANLKSLEALAMAHPDDPLCLVVGGEVTCPVTGPGKGGRNQAFVLLAAGRIAGTRRVVLSAGTDGRDGNSPSSGAVADGQTLTRARSHGLDHERYLAESDSYHFFSTLGDAIEIGFTDNNVRDVRLWMHFPG